MRALNYFNRIVFLLILAFSLITLCNSCDNTVNENNQNPKNTTDSESNKLEDFKSGTIVYSVEFPFFKDEQLMEFLPKEYKLCVSGDAMYGEMNSSFNAICNRFYSNNKSKELTQTFDNMGRKYQTKIDQSSMTSILNQIPKMKIQDAEIDTTVLGIPCKKTYAEFMIDSVPAVELIYTKELDLPNTNWINQYQEVDGFLLGYDVEQFGMRMRLRVKEIIPGEFSSNLENVYGKKPSEDYKTLNPMELQNEFRKLVESLSL